MAGKVSSGGSRRGRSEVTADPNVIPFIDVMLVLLVIFMIAAPISSVDIQVEMPDARIDPSKRPPRPTWISLNENGQVFVMNDEVSMADLGERTFEAVDENSPQLRGDRDDILDQRIYIRADAGIAYRNVVRVMNRLQDKGFTKIGFVAEDKR